MCGNEVSLTGKKKLNKHGGTRKTPACTGSSMDYTGAAAAAPAAAAPAAAAAGAKRRAAPKAGESEGESEGEGEGRSGGESKGGGEADSDATEAETRQPSKKQRLSGGAGGGGAGGGGSGAPPAAARRARREAWASRCDLCGGSAMLSVYVPRGEAVVYSKGQWKLCEARGEPQIQNTEYRARDEVAVPSLLRESARGGGGGGGGGGSDGV